VVTLQRITSLDISASALRIQLAAGRSVRFLVPPAVEEYVEARGLYRSEVGAR
jgi:nicotinate-nucleotide adenylyltransferase